jgi:hypothetical protein
MYTAGTPGDFVASGSSLVLPRAAADTRGQYSTLHYTGRQYSTAFYACAWLADEACNAGRSFCENADVACDHYHRFKEDVAVMRETGLKTYRLSISWPRLLADGRGSREGRRRPEEERRRDEGTGDGAKEVARTAGGKAAGARVIGG